MAMDHCDTVSLIKGILIVFEGIDGTGKSTQLKLLAESLTTKGYPVVSTREPTGGIYGQRIRDLFINRKHISQEEELELFLLDRHDHVEKVLLPNLAKRMVVLCDRYYLSTMAYQGAAGSDIKEIARKNLFAPEPDLALLFHMPASVSVKRITTDRGEALNDFEQEASLRRVAEIFDSLDYPYIRRINAEQSIDVVHYQIATLVEKHLQEFRTAL